MEERLKVGLIVKPQGVRGELKVQPLTDDYKRFSALKEVYVDGELFKVERVRYGNEEVYLTLFGVSDRNYAEALRGKFLFVDRKQAVRLPEDRYFIADLIGCRLTFGGEAFGELIEVTPSATDILTGKTDGGRIFRLPFLKDAVIRVDVENKLITLDEKRFGEITVYED